MATIKQLIGMALLLTLSGCSHFNVSSEWDCPKQTGVGCVNIHEADTIALRKAKRLRVEEL